MKQQGSNFVTPVGMIILGILILISAYFGITALEALLVAMLLLSLTAWFWSRHALTNLPLSAEQDECRGFPGQTLKASMSVTNGKYLPLIWLEASFPLTEDACVAPVQEGAETPCLKQHFLWVTPKQSIVWQQEALARKRGIARFERLQLTSGDGFGLSSLTKAQPLSGVFRFVVYPEVHSVNIAPITRRLRELEPHQRGYYTDPTLISTIRHYQPGDNVRQINWRQLARTGSLQINVHESMRMSRFCLIPDLQSFTYKKLEKQGDVEKVVTAVHQDLLEEMLSLTASIIVAAQEQKYLCSLVIPATNQQPPRIIIPDSLDAQVTQLLTALAEIEYHGEAAPLPFRDMEDSAHLLGQAFLLSRTYRKPENTDISPAHIILKPNADTPSAYNILDAKELKQ